MAGPPTGTVTFLFTDIEGSIRLLTGGARDLPARHIDAPMLAVECTLQEPYLAARSRLGTAAWEEGRSMTTEEAVAYALENTEDRA